jgi:uncharacterized protein DUF3987
MTIYPVEFQRRLEQKWANMSRYSGGEDNEFWLEAWNGSAYTVERMGRPPIAVNHLLVGVVGGLQPDKLARSFRGITTACMHGSF